MRFLASIRYMLGLSRSIEASDLVQSPEEGLQRLLAGNERYIKDALEHPNRSQDRREAMVARQTPFAIILGCSDSRVSPEIIFDQGVGDLFVVRVAGNVIGALELDSIEYAAKYLQSVVILVMGHENCGAVDAVLNGNTADIEAIAQIIGPAVEEAKRLFPTQVFSNAVKINTLRMKNLLLNSSVLKMLVEENKLQIHAAYYNLQTGIVDLI